MIQGYVQCILFLEHHVNLQKMDLNGFKMCKNWIPNGF